MLFQIRIVLTKTILIFYRPLPLPDQFFSLVTAVLRRAPVLETPSQVQVYLQEQLGKSRPEPVRVSKLEVA